MRRFARCASAPLCCLVLAGCASTAITVDPPSQAPVCDRTATALVLWAPEWRPDQKDVAEREMAAATGLDDFFGSSGCFARSALRRTSSLKPDTIASQAALSPDPTSRMVVIGVRELGPVLKLLSSPALVEGGTEVVLRVTAYEMPATGQPREFTIHWRSGGPGVVKGTASLAADMQAALKAGLMSSTAAR